MGSIHSWLTHWAARPQCSELSVEIKRLFHMSRLQSFVKLFNFHETNISIYFLSDVSAQHRQMVFVIICVTLPWQIGLTSQNIRTRNCSGLMFILNTDESPDILTSASACGQTLVTILSQVRVPLQPRESRGRELERRGLLPVRPPLHHRAPDVPHGIKLAHSG